jgi:hypothetical protein
MGTSVIAALASGAMAFAGVISVNATYTIFRWCLLLGFVPGFILHTIAVVRQKRKKGGRSNP